jgi:hypothetical protein
MEGLQEKRRFHDGKGPGYLFYKIACPLFPFRLKYPTHKADRSDRERDFWRTGRSLSLMLSKIRGIFGYAPLTYLYLPGRRGELITLSPSLPKTLT